jgi:G3E family GTPase
MSRLANVPTLVVTGRRGAGKTTLIARLLGERPASATWAVLVNERGAARIEPAPGVAVAEVAGGCPCCTAHLSLRVALTRLLREARPARLFVELDAESHVDATLKTLSGPWLAPVLALGPVVEVVDRPRFGATGAARTLIAADELGRATLAALYGTRVSEPR